MPIIISSTNDVFVLFPHLSSILPAVLSLSLVTYPLDPDSVFLCSYHSYVSVILSVGVPRSLATSTATGTPLSLFLLGRLLFLLYCWPIWMLTRGWPSPLPDYSSTQCTQMMPPSTPPDIHALHSNIISFMDEDMLLTVEEAFASAFEESFSDRPYPKCFSDSFFHLRSIVLCQWKELYSFRSLHGQSPRFMLPDDAGVPERTAGIRFARASQFTRWHMHNISPVCPPPSWALEEVLSDRSYLSHWEEEPFVRIEIANPQDVFAEFTWEGFASLAGAVWDRRYKIPLPAFSTIFLSRGPPIFGSIKVTIVEFATNYRRVVVSTLAYFLPVDHTCLTPPCGSTITPPVTIDAQVSAGYWMLAID